MDYDACDVGERTGLCACLFGGRKGHGSVCPLPFRQARSNPPLTVRESEYQAESEDTSLSCSSLYKIVSLYCKFSFFSLLFFFFFVLLSSLLSHPSS